MCDRMQMYNIMNCSQTKSIYTNESEIAMCDRMQMYNIIINMLQYQNSY
jgi:hypothetical protein